MEPEDQNLTIDIPKGIQLDTDESKKISDVLDKTNKNLSMKGKVEEKKPELTEYQAPNLDALNQAIGGDMSALKTGLFKSSLINQAIKNQSEQRQAELENRAYDKFSSDQRNLIGQANAQLQPFNEFKPPKESMGQVAGFQAAMMLFAGLIGGKGALGGMAALNAAGGMMKGYADGQKEVFEKAKQEFEENMRVVQANNSRVMEILKNNMELAKTDLQVATNKAKNDFIINGQPTIADAISKAGLPAFTQFYGNALKDMNDGLKVIDSLGGGDEKKLADSIVLNSRVPKTEKEMIAVQKYYPEYKAVNKQYGPMGVFEQAIPGSSENFKGETEKKDAQSSLEALGSAAKVLKDSENPNIKFGQVPVLWQNIKQRIRSNLEGMGFKDDGKSTYYTQLPNGQTLGEYIQSQIAQTPVDPNDQNAVFQKETAFSNFDVERAARGGSVLPVGFLKVSGPLLDPKQYTREAFQAVYQDRVNSLDRKLSTYGFDQEDRKKIYDTYGRTIGYPVLNVNGKTSQLPSGLPDGSKKIGKTPDGKKDVWQTPDGKKYAIDAGVQ